MGYILKRTIRRQDGLLLWQCLYHRNAQLTSPTDISCPFIEETVDLETGELIHRYEYGIEGRITVTFPKDGHFEVVPAECNGECLVSNPLDSGILVQIISPEVRDVQPGCEFRSPGPVKWREIPLESGVLQEV